VCVCVCVCVCARWCQSNYFVVPFLKTLVLGNHDDQQYSDFLQSLFTLLYGVRRGMIVHAVR
jgi:hypothetical protein